VLTLAASAVLSNTAADTNGGIGNSGGTLTLINVTASGNTAKTDGGGLRTSSGGTTTLNNVTVTNNTADSDGDGTGYPRGLRGELIPLAARLFAVVDVWDALRSDRPYRPGWPEDKVREHIRAGAGAHFDPRAVEIFLDVNR